MLQFKQHEQLLSIMLRVRRPGSSRISGWEVISRGWRASRIKGCGACNPHRPAGSAVWLYLHPPCAVRDMLYNHGRHEIVTAGSYGVKAWACEMDHEAYRNDKDVDPYAIPRSKDGQILPWAFGKYQHARQRMQYR